MGRGRHPKDQGQRGHERRHAHLKGDPGLCPPAATPILKWDEPCPPPTPACTTPLCAAGLGVRAPSTRPKYQCGSQASPRRLKALLGGSWGSGPPQPKGRVYTHLCRASARALSSPPGQAFPLLAPASLPWAPSSAKGREPLVWGSLGLGCLPDPLLVPGKVEGGVAHSFRLPPGPGPAYCQGLAG